MREQLPITVGAAVMLLADPALALNLKPLEASSSKPPFPSSGRTVADFSRHPIGNVLRYHNCHDRSQCLDAPACN